MIDKPDDKAKALNEWRLLHFGELDFNLTVLKGIRDDKTAKHKDRIEAAKGIAKMLDAVSPEKITVASKEKEEKAKKARDIPHLSPELQERLKAIGAKPS